MMKTLQRFLSLLLCLGLVPVSGFAYDVPRQDSKTEYFYVFGPGGNPLDGKESDEFQLFVDVPAEGQDPVTIKMYDPDTSGKLDAGTAPWDTEMEVTVSGSSQLDKQTFGMDSYDGEYYQFGPYDKTKGEKVGDKYRFAVKVKALSGDDLNLFNFKVSPEYADTFSPKFTFVLLPNKGDRMYFYPEVPAGTSKVIARNFDLDKEGGIGQLKDVATGKRYDVQDSESGQWAETEIPVSVDSAYRFEYRVTTQGQIRGHAGVEFKDDKGNSLPIYFRKGPKPVKKEAPPAPAPKATLACNQFTFDARKSYDPEKKNLTYLWNFGDGATSEEPVVTHIYEKGGQYDVTLTVSDNSGLNCEKDTTTSTVQVNTPPKAAFALPQLTCVGEKIVLDASGSTDDNPENISYLWNLGDGTTAEGARVTKTYEKGGVYNVGLTVNDNAGTSCSVDAVNQTVKVNAAPVANAGEDKVLCLRSAGAKYVVNFDGSSSYDPDKDQLAYRWDFGDGETAEGAKAAHEYAKGGDYTARLSVTDGSGASCDGASDTVNVKLNKAPIAVAGKDQFTCAGQQVTFDASGSQVEDETSAVYTWNFGDGETATGKTVTHSYSKGGDYHVTLNVNDGKGTDCSEAADAFTVHVNSAPQAVLNQVEALCTGDKVAFDASGSSDADGQGLKYTWDFGDGTTVTSGAKAEHKYAKGGSYRVTVTADDQTGGSCATSSDNITVKVNTPPVANVGPNVACCVEETTPFDGTGSSDPDGDSLSYRWDFGDGSSSTEAKAGHSYSQSGRYNVVLTVDDNSNTRCNKSSAGYVADVNAKPVSVIQVIQK